MCVLDLVQLGDAVDPQLEGRSGLEVGLVVVAVEDRFVSIGREVAVGIGCERGGDSFAANGELAGVEDVQAAVLDGCDGLVDLFLGAGCAGLAERSELDSVSLIALAPVGVEGLAVHNSVECVLIEDFPDVGRRGQSGGRSNCEHVDVVADAVDGGAGVKRFLAGGRSAGGVSVLADDDAAVGDQSLGSFVFSGDVEPGVGVLDLHGDIGNDALHAKEERGVAGNDFCVRISADIADLDLAVSILVLVFDLAFVDELLQLHTGDDAADVTGFIDAGEGIVEVCKAIRSGGVAGHSDELHVGIFLSGLTAEGLMAVGVGDDDLAALIDAVDAGVIAGLVLADGVFPDDVVLADAQSLGGFLDALDVGVGVAFVFVADQNDADLDVGADSVAGGLSGFVLSRSVGLFRGSGGLFVGGDRA